MKNQKNKGFLSQCAYGLADIYGGGAFVVISTFYTVFLTKAMGMNTALAGTIPLIGKIWDAITDPIMGNICDRTQSRFGAKRFYILIGSIVSAITFILMWISFKTSTLMGQYFFYMGMYMLFSTGFTIVMVPYNGLLPDMVDDYVERSRFSGTRMIFSTFGAILAGLIPTIFIKDNTNAALYLEVALLFGVLFLICILLTFAGTWERKKEPIRISFKESFIQSFTVFKSKSFKLFLLIFLFGQGAADFVTGLAVYYVDDVLNAYGGGRFTILMGVLLVAQFLGTILFRPIMAKTSKKFPILVAVPVRIVATLTMLFFSYEGANFVIILVLSFFVGIGMASTSTSIYAILTDMADIDELITSINRPATVSAMATFVRKVATGFSAAIIGVLLAMVGYNEVIAAAGGRQSIATQHGIGYIFVLVPVFFCLLTWIVAKLFPVDKKEFEVVHREIQRRKGLDNSNPTPEEIATCEKVTGMSFDRLWNPDNAFKMKA